MRFALVLGLTAAVAWVPALPGFCEEPGVDLIAKAHEFVTTVYLRPLNITGATLHVSTEYFPPGELPLCADVAVLLPDWPSREESPTISVCFASGRLWFAAASKEFVDFYSRKAVAESVRKQRIHDTLVILQKWACVEPARDRERVAHDRFSTNFRVVQSSRYLSESGVSAVFNARSGLLGVFGLPFPRDAR